MSYRCNFCQQVADPKDCDKNADGELLCPRVITERPDGSPGATCGCVVGKASTFKCPTCERSFEAFASSAVCTGTKTVDVRKCTECGDEFSPHDPKSCDHDAPTVVVRYEPEHKVAEMEVVK